MTGGARRSGRVGGQRRWVTVRGELSGLEVDAACASMGLPVGRERRRRWQRCGFLPLPAATRPAYHRDCASLIAFVHAMTQLDPRRTEPEKAAYVHEAIRLLRVRANDRGDSAAAEDRFYAAVRAAHETLKPAIGARDASADGAAASLVAANAGPPPRPPRWVTAAGSMTAHELEDACAQHGVRLDRARRTYWQAERVLPQPERRLLRPPEGNGGARGYYHPGCVDLARLVDYIVSADHPAKSPAWRCSVRELSAVIAAWRAEAAGSPGASEGAFYDRVRGLIPLVEQGAPIPDLHPCHRDVLPPGQSRLGGDERDAALRTTAQVAQAIVDDWLTEHGNEPPPERLVVWFRLERSGPVDWRIADAGARRTSHEAQRARDAG